MTLAARAARVTIAYAAPMIEIHGVEAAGVEPLLTAMRADDLDVIVNEGRWLGARVDGRLIGVARLFQRDGHQVVDDVWVDPAFRRRGVATALLARATGETAGVLWLICDVPDIGFYARRGFSPVAADAFPPPLAAHYAAKREWPAAPDHEHVAMRSG